MATVRPDRMHHLEYVERRHCVAPLHIVKPNASRQRSPVSNARTPEKLGKIGECPSL